MMQGTESAEAAAAAAEAAEEKRLAAEMKRYNDDMRRYAAEKKAFDAHQWKVLVAALRSPHYETPNPVSCSMYREHDCFLGVFCNYRKCLRVL